MLLLLHSSPFFDVCSPITNHESLFPSAFGALPDEKRLADEIEKTRDLLEQRTRK
jgi:hypothetical protein